MKKLVAALSLCTLFFSCEKEIPLNQEEIDPRIVVNGIFEANDTIFIHLSESRNVLYEGILPDLTSATATLHDASDNLLGTFTAQGGGIYYLADYIPVSGMTYKIKMSSTGFDDATAQSQAPTPISISSIDTLRKGDFMTYEIKFNDDPAAENYYAVTVTRVSVFEDEFGMLSYYEDPAFYTNEIYTQNGTADVDGTKWGTIFLFSDATFNGGTCSFYAENYLSEFEDSVFMVVGVRSLSEDYFKYNVSLDKYHQTDGDPFAQPVQVYSNVENGFGIFGGYSVSTDTLFMP